MYTYKLKVYVQLGRQNHLNVVHEFVFFPSPSKKKKKNYKCTLTITFFFFFKRCTERCAVYLLPKYEETLLRTMKQHDHITIWSVKERPETKTNNWSLGSGC